jgi:hypothetical protein
LEVLLLLHADPRRPFTAADLGRELRINADWAGDQMRVLCDRGLLACTMPSPATYRYAPQSPELDAAVRGLAAAYADYRVTVTSLIFAKPEKPDRPDKAAEQIRSFADAFRIRRDDKHG